MTKGIIYLINCASGCASEPFVGYSIKRMETATKYKSHICWKFTVANMQLLSSVFLLILVAWSARAAIAMPAEETLAQYNNGGFAKERKDFILKILSELSDFNILGKEMAALNSDQVKESQLGERSIFNQYPPKERTPCKNFFWKTFSTC
ncbi:somatostatin-2-like [Acipenser oxyrinchus oxyrinchus]|uniref:Somatostatin-2-like n=1 Tax=Acipenser oxyrinchus oxyrinchus TaxID=40147 RepID=A0AAD8CZG9_ACIOX|nr:somatostatin-2-like [Acipenser oxyrinchus oxyrinchus]